MARPLARFKDSNGQYYQAEWQPYVLSSLVNRVTRKNSENQTNIPLTMSARDGLIDQESYFNKTVASSDLSNYTLLYQGEFAYNHSSSKGYDYGAIHRLTKVSCGAVTPLYFCFNIKDQANIDSDFLAYYFESQKWTREVASICSKGARQHGALNISVDDFFNIIIYVPSIEEQRQVVRIASSIDTTINQMESIVDAWEQRKKGVAQKLFNQEVRFKADDGSDFPEWKQMSLDEACCINPKTGPLADKFYYMDLNSVDSGHWNAPQLLNKAEAPSRARRVADQDDVFFQSVRPYNMGHYHFTQKRDKQVVASTGFIQARMRNGCNSFLYHLFFENSFNEKINILCTGSSYPAINATEFGKIAVPFPSAPEQRKIAECLDAIDDVIALSKAELEKWRELKKGLLQQLFV